MMSMNRRLFLAGSACASAAAVLSSTGCTWLQKQLGVGGSGAPLEPMPTEHFVKYLNDQANALDAVTYEDVSVTVGMGTLIDPDLSATIDCAKPRSFRMKANHFTQSGVLDVGSNEQQFWMYVRQNNPKYLYATHEDLASGRARLPVPFDPDWVFMALGMSPVDPASNPTVKIDTKYRQYVLTSTTRTPQGMTVKKITGFAGDTQTDSSPQVKWHAVVDAQTNHSIAEIDIRKVKRMEVRNPRTGEAAYVAIPVDMRLIFNSPDGQKLKLDMVLRRERINPTYTPNQMAHLFTMPKISGAEPVNLANLNFNPASGSLNARGQMGRR